MKKNILIIIIALGIFAIALGFFLYAATQNVETEVKNEVVEEISQTKDIEHVSYQDSILYKADGAEVKISDYKGKPIMLLFFNKGTEESIAVLDKVEELYKNYEDTIQFFMINTAQEVDQELEDKYEIEIYYDFYKETIRNYNITEIPSMIYINKENEVFNAKAGFTTTDALEANLDILSDNI